MARQTYTREHCRGCRKDTIVNTRNLLCMLCDKLERDAAEREVRATCTHPETVPDVIPATVVCTTCGVRLHQGPLAADEAGRLAFPAPRAIEPEAAPAPAGLVPLSLPVAVA